MSRYLGIPSSSSFPSHSCIHLPPTHVQSRSLTLSPLPIPCDFLDMLLLIPELVHFIELLLCTRRCINELEYLDYKQQKQIMTNWGKRKCTKRWLEFGIIGWKSGEETLVLVGAKADPETKQPPTTQDSNVRQGYKMAGPLWTVVWQLLTRLNIQLSSNPIIPLLGTYPREIRAYVQKTLETLFIIARNWRQFKYPSSGDWNNKLWYNWYNRAMEYYSAIDRKVAALTIAWMNLTDE